MAVFSVILGMFAFGFSNVCWKPLLNEHSTRSLLMKRSCYSAVLLLVLLLIFSSSSFGNYSSLSKLTTGSSQNGYNLGVSVFYIGISLAGLYFFVNSLRYQQTGISGVIICLSSTISACLGWILNREAFSSYLLVALLASIAGVLLIEKFDLRTNPARNGMLMALLAACCWGYANIGFKQELPRLGVLKFSILQELVVVAVSGGLLLVKKTPVKVQESITSGNHLKLISNRFLLPLISLSTVIGILFCNLGMQQLPVSVFAVLILAQPTTTFIFSRILLKERITVLQRLGMALVLAGIYLAAIH